jgi:DNA-binding NtrC family response regulator
MRILIVDDEPTITEVMSEMLSDTYEVCVAACANEALDLLAHDPCRVVLTDFNMPGMDGGVLSKHICNKYPDTRVIIFTGSDDIEDIRKQSEAIQVLRKPINWTVLLGMLSDIEQED